MQLSPWARHAQRPLRQVICPQHWSLAVQLPGASRQHTGAAPIGARHDSPSQHSAAVRHGPGAARQVLTGRTQRPSAPHRSPAPQGVPLAQQPWYSSPQGGVTQDPPTQRAPAGHATPHRPQCAASVAGATQMLAQHSPPAAHAPPAQHACPTAPQGTSQRPATHERPAMQAFSALQQTCPLPPQVGTGRQRRAMHAKPGAQATPLQQGSSLPPQPDAGSHRAARQT